MGIYSPSLSHMLGSWRVPMRQQRPAPGRYQESVERIALACVIAGTIRSSWFFFLLLEGL